MPIPTDTFWNIKRLNIWFAVSGVLLMAVTGWAIIQDYNQPWRQPQRAGKVWDAAFVSDKLSGENTAEKKARLAELDRQIEQGRKDLASRQQQIDDLTKQTKKLESDQSTLEFDYNIVKANVTVAQGQLQDAVTAGNTSRADELRKSLADPEKKLASQAKQLEDIKTQIVENKQKLAAMTADVDALTKERTRLTADAEALRKKLEATDPDAIPSFVGRTLAKGSELARAMPLLQFVNPAEKVQQIVLPDVQTDVAFMKITTIDRCTTCHVNIARKDFTEDKVIAYLEEQLATARRYNLPAVPTGKSADPAALATRPGPVAMPEFWHAWASTIAPDLLKKPAQANRLKTLSGQVGKTVSVTVNGRKLDTFVYAPDPAKKDEAASAAIEPAMRDTIISSIVSGWARYGKRADGTTPAVRVDSAELGGRAGVVVEIKENQPETPRVGALKYVEDLAAAMRASVPKEQWSLLMDRYRRAMIAGVNGHRRGEGLARLDDSRALLAHPRLDLYVDVDSKHSFEAVGCTSCHDGSGQETNFVLTAHTPRPIWVDSKTGTPVLASQLDKSKLPAGHHGQDLSSMLEAVYPEQAVVPRPVSDIHLDAHHADSAAHPTTQKAPAHAGEPTADGPPVPYVDPVTGATGRAVSQMRHWIEKYEPSAPRSFKLVYHEWDWPMRPFRYLQTNCVRCHTDVYDIKEEAPKVYEGRSLFVNMGCANCHLVENLPADDQPKNVSDIKLIAANGQRKVGTDLRNINAKLSPAFINSWVWAPKAFRPSTKMPHFFMLENNSSNEELRRTRQEARAITEYLVRTASRYENQFTPPAGAKGSPDAGRAIFASVGCQGCHTNLNDPTGQQRAGKPVTLGERWIVNDLARNGELARKLEEETGKTPDNASLTAAATKLYDGMTYNERHVYATEHLGPDYSGIAAKYPDGSAKPVFQHHGPELSGVGTKLTAGRTVDEARAWLFNWLKDPRHYSEYTVMPRLRLSDQQALDVTEYLLAQKRTNDKPDDPWKAELADVDSPKLVEMTALFLKSRYTWERALEHADDDRDLTDLATEALTTAVNPTDQARAAVAKMNKDEKRLVFLGKKLISHYGCMNCHAINGTEAMSSPCANLSDWGQKGVDKLDFGYLDHHKLSEMKADDHGNPMPAKLMMVNGMSAEATGLLKGPVNAAKEVAVSWPHLGHSRVDWITQKLNNTRIFDRGKVLLEPGSDPKKNPGGPYDKLKMPTFYLNDKEVDAIVTFVLSNRDKLVTKNMLAKSITEESKRIAEGRRIVQKYSCTNCHAVDGNAPSVQQFYEATDLTTKAPPSLRGEGNKVQHGWLFNFLKNVEPLRPLLYMTPESKPGIRMPSFPLTDQESTAVAAYFAAASNHESRNLNKQVMLVNKYVKDQHDLWIKPVPVGGNPTTVPAAAAPTVVADLIRHAGALTMDQEYSRAADVLTAASAIAKQHKLSEQRGTPTTKPVADRLDTAIKDLKTGMPPNVLPWPGDDWYTRPEFTIGSNTVDNLRGWALTQGMINPLQLDPTKNSIDDLNRIHRTIRYDVNFVAELFDAPYPFVDTPRPEVSQDRFQLGEKFFYELQCLKCHVLGDPQQPGANNAPTAPNLSLTQRRLQRRWVRHWVQEPPIIQTGTAMPPFFTGGPLAQRPIWDIHGQSWPRAQKSERPVDAVEKDYGNTVEQQTDLLLDFVYAAGVRGYTGVQPAGAPQPAGEVKQSNPAAGVPREQQVPATHPGARGDPARGTPAEPPAAPSPKSPAATAPAGAK